MSEAAVETPAEGGGGEEVVGLSAEDVAPAPAVAPSAFDSFRENLPTDLRSNPVWDQYKDRGLEGVAKDFVEQGRLIGSETRISRPAEGAPPEDWDRFYNTLGRPETPDGYDLGDFTPPEGLPWDEDQAQRLTERMHTVGLTNNQLKQAMQAVAEEQNADYQKGLLAAQEFVEKSSQELRTEWGAAYDSELELGERAWNTVFGDRAADLANLELPGYGKLGAVPEVVKAFAKLGHMLAEDKLVSGDSKSPVMTQAAAQAEYERMESDPGVRAVLADTNHPEHKAMTRQWMQFAEMANR